MERERFDSLKDRLQPVPPEDVEAFQRAVRERVVEPCLKRRIERAKGVEEARRRTLGARLRGAQTC